MHSPVIPYDKDFSAVELPVYTDLHSDLTWRSRTFCMLYFVYQATLSDLSNLEILTNFSIERRLTGLPIVGFLS